MRETGVLYGIKRIAIDHENDTKVLIQPLVHGKGQLHGVGCREEGARRVLAPFLAELQQADRAVAKKLSAASVWRLLKLWTIHYSEEERQSIAKEAQEEDDDANVY